VAPRRGPRRGAGRRRAGARPIPTGTSAWYSGGPLPAARSLAPPWPRKGLTFAGVGGMRLRAGATPLQEIASVPDRPLDCMTMGQIGMVLGLFGHPRRL